METLADISAGLGLFFIGVRLIGNNLKELSGPWFRRVVARTTDSPFRAACVGILSGALTQSSSAITFVAVSLTSAGVLRLPRAVQLVVWSNVGTSALVLLAVHDLRLVVLYMIAATGLGFFLNLDRSPRWRHPLGSALGIALLFLGIALIKESGTQLRDLPEVAEALTSAAVWLPMAFVAGAAFTVVAQSSATVSVVAVTLTAAGLLSVDQTAMIVFGASIGSGLSVWLFSASLKGSGRQVALVQVMAKSAGVALLLPVYIAALVVGSPGAEALHAAAAAAPERAVALLYLLLQVVSALALSLLNRSALALAARAAPQDEEERLSLPRYLYDQAVEEPQTAIDLARREQARIFGHLPELLDMARPEAGPPRDPAPLLEASRSLVLRCDVFLTELLDATTSRELTLAVVELEKCNQILNELVATVGEQLGGPWRSLGSGGAANERLRALLMALIESEHFLLLTAADAAQAHANDGDAADVELLVTVSGDRSKAMDALRHRVAGEIHLTAAQHSLLYAATALFERAVWLVHRYALLLGGNAKPRIAGGRMATGAVDPDIGRS
ncbi:MAG: Na/Pi cotransporter family protein [Panacagrimonas sp.]